MARGDIRRAILSALQEGPAHGYAVMRRLEEMSGGLWRPSPGSVYPHLQMLEDEGMVGSSEQDGTRVFHLTDAGVAAAANGTSAASAVAVTASKASGTRVIRAGTQARRGRGGGRTRTRRGRPRLLSPR